MAAIDNAPVGRRPKRSTSHRPSTGPATPNAPAAAAMPATETPESRRTFWAYTIGSCWPAR
jgi:hypothetical protein